MAAARRRCSGHAEAEPDRLIGRRDTATRLGAFVRPRTAARPHHPAHDCIGWAGRTPSCDGRYLSTIFLAQFNVRKPQLADKRVRQAFAYAIDRQALLKIVFRGYGKPATGPVPSSVVNYYSGDVKKYPLDLKQAAALLDAAGLKRGPVGKRLKVTSMPSRCDEC